MHGMILNLNLCLRVVLTKKIRVCVNALVRFWISQKMERVGRKTHYLAQWAPTQLSRNEASSFHNTSKLAGKRKAGTLESSILGGVLEHAIKHIVPGPESRTVSAPCSCRLHGQHYPVHRRTGHGQRPKPVSCRGDGRASCFEAAKRVSPTHSRR